MDNQILARNIRRFRASKRFSQSELAKTSGISLSEIKNIELAKNAPRMRTVQQIAAALGIPLENLFLPVRDLQTVRFRSSRRMQNRENVLADVANWLDNYNYLESLYDSRIKAILPGIRADCLGKNALEASAICRRKLGLKPDEPMRDICGLFESAGIKVLSYSSASDGFFGLSVREENGGPAVIVNTWDRISTERKIFSAAHELGHLILHPKAYDITLVDEDKQEEALADVFAAHFLMPDGEFKKEWKEASGIDWVERVLKIKQIFLVSYKTVLHRLIEHGIADNSIWKIFHQAFKLKYGRSLTFKEEPRAIPTAEPFGSGKFGFYEDRFYLLLRGAIEKDCISLSRGAEMLGIGISDMQERIRGWEIAP